MAEAEKVCQSPHTSLQKTDDMHGHSGSHTELASQSIPDAAKPWIVANLEITAQIGRHRRPAIAIS
jgi:hypothetical protein